MRLRNITGSREVIAENEYVIHDPEKKKGQWHSVFGNDAPIRLEIGMGKGRFLMTLAAQHPEINYLGIEKYSSVLLRALQKMEETPLPNLRFIRMDAEYITDVFDKEEIDRIYLNFSDPWPKVRHAKHRLTSDRFLARYAQILKQEGVVELKTDNMGLYDFTLESLQAAGWTVLDQTRDLHHDPVRLAGNILTEYELRFLRQNKPIGKIIFRQ